MDSEKKQLEERNMKFVTWDEFQQELARLSSLSSALHEANQNKFSIQQKLKSLLQLDEESLKWSYELDDMREKLEARKLMIGNISMHSKVVIKKAKKQQEQLNCEIRSLLLAGSALSVASRRLQEANKSLGGERWYVQLRNLQKKLKARQQFMASQISLLYPVTSDVTRHTHEHELESYTSSRKSDAASFTISGLHLSVRPFTKMNFFTDRKEVSRSATALGYIAHAVSLIALYIEIPLRYPLRLGASRTYICDYAPSFESISDLASKPTEFPLFMESQDTTRSAYAVFLLNKDIEQLLNGIGVESLGPRHVLANFKELLNNILSGQYIHN